MNPRQEHAVAPLQCFRAGCEDAAQHEALGLEVQQGGVGVGVRHAERYGECRSGDRPDERHPTLAQRRDRLLSGPRARGARRWRRDRGIKSCAGVDGEDLGESFGGDPDCCGGSAVLAGSAARNPAYIHLSNRHS